MLFQLLLPSAWLVSTAFGHGAMTRPYSWFDPRNVGYQPNSMCSGDYQPCMWFTNQTFVEKPVIPDDSPLRTYQDIIYGGYQKSDWTAHNPWRAPGQAHIWSPCGINGG